MDNYCIYDTRLFWLIVEYVRNLDAIYFNDNSTQSLSRTYLTLSLAKTQGSVHVRINQQILLNYFIYKQVKTKLTWLARWGQNTDN